MNEPACILCWCRNRDTIVATMFDGIAWYCDEHGEQVITDRLRPRWIRQLGRWLGWMQCAVVAAGIGLTLDDMKKINRRHQ